MKCLSPCFTLLLILFTVAVFAQDYQPPVSVPKTKEEFVASEKDFIAASKWLESTPLGKDDKTRKATNTWVIAWLTNSPTVTTTVYEPILDLFDKNPDLMFVYLASYGRYVLENSYSKNELQNNLAGIKSMITCVNLGGDLKKDKELNKLLETDKEGKLEEWIKKAIEKK